MSWRLSSRLVDVGLLGCAQLVLSCGGRVTFAEDESGVGSSAGSDAGSGIEPSPYEGEDLDEDLADDELEVELNEPFGEAVLLFEDPGWFPQALSPTRDELELFYASLAQDRSLDDSGERHVIVRKRASVDEPFGEPELVDELLFLCGAMFDGTELAALDVSGDGLRLYIGCNSFTDSDYPDGPLLVATRSDRESPFSVDPVPVGYVGFSLGLSRDELTAFGTSRDPSVEGVLMYERTSPSDTFGDGRVVPGAVDFMNPEPVPGGLALLGVDATDGAHIVLSVRPSVNDAFGPPQTEGLPVPPAGHSDYSPALSGDGRTLYFTRLDGASPRNARVMVARR